MVPRSYLVSVSSLSIESLSAQTGPTYALGNSHRFDYGQRDGNSVFGIHLIAVSFDSYCGSAWDFWKRTDGTVAGESGIVSFQVQGSWVTAHVEFADI